MEHLKSLKEITEICNQYGIKNWELDSDGKVRVDGNVYSINQGLIQIPLDFSYVSGSFNCRNNQLTSLEGCPKEVGGHFDCTYNQLTSLEGCPKKVGGDFFCYNNQIKDLSIDYRIDVGGDIYLGSNPHPPEILNLNDDEKRWLFKYGYEYWHLWHDGKLNLRWWKELRLSMDEELKENK